MRCYNDLLLSFSACSVQRFKTWLFKWMAKHFEFHSSFEILNMHNVCDTKMSRFVVLRVMRRHQQLPSACRDFKLQRMTT